MSAQATRDLVERMKTDEAFRERILAETEPDARLGLIRAEGYDCSHDDIASFGDALADAHLDVVNAGLWDVCPVNTCSTDCTADGTRY